MAYAVQTLEVLNGGLVVWKLICRVLTVLGKLKTGVL